MFQFILVTALVLVLIFHGLIIFAANRAHRQTKIAVPVLWQRILAGILVFIITSALFIALISP